MKNTITNDILRFPADKNGLFYVNLQDGKYRIDELYIKKYGYDGSWAFLHTNSALKVLEVERGKVNNIGTIQWSVVDRKHDAVQIDSSSDIKIKFLQKFPESTWSQKEWKYKKIVNLPTNAPRK